MTEPTERTCPHCGELMEFAATEAVWAMIDRVNAAPSSVGQRIARMVLGTEAGNLRQRARVFREFHEAGPDASELLALACDEAAEALEKWLGVVDPPAPEGEGE